MENSLKKFKKICSHKQQNKTSDSNQTNSNDSDNFKNNFNKTSTSQLITTSNSIHFNSYDNNSKGTSKQNKINNLNYVAKTEINLGLESIKFSKDDYILSSMNDFKDIKENCLSNNNQLILHQEYDNNVNNNLIKNNKSNFNKNLNFKTIDHQIEFEFINKKKARDLISNAQNDKKEVSKISDLFADKHIQGMKFENNNNGFGNLNNHFNNNGNGHFNYNNINNDNNCSKKNLNRDQIIDDLRVNLLKHNLEAKKNDNNQSFDKTLENMVSMELLFYQLTRLYTSRNNKLVKSFIIKKINELIIEDNIFENLLLLSKIQILKDNKVNKNKLKKQYLRKIIELISNDQFFHLMLSNCKLILLIIFFNIKIKL